MNPIRPGPAPQCRDQACPRPTSRRSKIVRTLMSVGSIAGTVFNDANVSYTPPATPAKRGSPTSASISTPTTTAGSTRANRAC